MVKAVPLQIVAVWFGITGLGFTCIVKIEFAPAQPTPEYVKVGVAVIIAITGVDVILAATKGAIFPVPKDAKPIEDAELFQVYAVVPIVLIVLKVIAEVDDPIQTT